MAQAATSDSAATLPSAESSPEMKGRPALELKLSMLEQGRARLEKIGDYTATFIKQERIDGSDLQDVHTIHMKVRHEPFSVYMKWLVGPVGQEVLYVNGQHDNRMLVKKGGRMGKLLPVVKLDPTGTLAMAESRHPVTDAGLLTLTVQIVKYSTRDVELQEGITCRMIRTQIHNRRCHCFFVDYASTQVDPLYRKSITYIDEELSIPIYIKNFAWPSESGSAAAGESQNPDEDLIEYYAYTDIQFDRRLAESEFDHSNKQYSFKR